MPKYDWLLTAKVLYSLSTYREGSDVESTFGDVLQSLCIWNSLSQIYFLQSQIETGKRKKNLELFSKLVIQSIFYLQISRLSKKDFSGNEEFLGNMKWHNIWNGSAVIHSLVRVVELLLELPHCEQFWQVEEYLITRD